MEKLKLSHPKLSEDWMLNYAGDMQKAIAANIVKLNIYYESLTYKKYTQVPSYNEFQFVSDLGELSALCAHIYL